MDLESSVSFISSLSDEMNLTISKDNVLLIAELTEPNPSTLKGALLRIKASSELLGEKIN